MHSANNTYVKKNRCWRLICAKSIGGPHSIYVNFQWIRLKVRSPLKSITAGKGAKIDCNNESWLGAILQGDETAYKNGRNLKRRHV